MKAAVKQQLLLALLLWPVEVLLFTTSVHDFCHDAVPGHGGRTLSTVATMVTPDTLMRWHRRLIAVKWTHQAKRRAGRTSLMKKIRVLILLMTRENSRWGYTRIEDDLKGVGHTVARTTVANVL